MYRKALIALAILIAMAGVTAGDDNQTDNICQVEWPGGWSGLCQTEEQWAAGWYVFKHGWTWTWENRGHLRGALADVNNRSWSVSHQESMSRTSQTQSQSSGRFSWDSLEPTGEWHPCGESLCRSLGTTTFPDGRKAECSETKRPATYRDVQAGWDWDDWIGSKRCQGIPTPKERAKVKEAKKTETSRVKEGKVPFPYTTFCTVDGCTNDPFVGFVDGRLFDCRPESEKYSGVEACS